jgi:polyketide biosynthesis enoyl-CoA hydratase PksH
MNALIDLDISGPLARVTMQSRATRNSLDSALVAELHAALSQAEGSSEVRGWVLSAAGPDFCTGGMQMLGETPSSQEESRDSASVWETDIAATKAFFTALVSSPLITIAVVDGMTIGGGVGLVSACDHVIAGPAASLRLTETLWGLVPALIFPLIAHRTGAQRAFTLALTNQAIDGERAAAIGLADEFSPDTAAALRRFARSLGSSEAGAARALKQHYRALFPVELDRDGESTQLLLERLAAPAFAERSARLRTLGVLP